MKALRFAILITTIISSQAYADVFSSFEPVATHIFKTKLKSDHKNIEDAFNAVDQRNADVIKAYNDCKEAVTNICFQAGLKPKSDITIFDREQVKDEVFALKCRVKCK